MTLSLGFNKRGLLDRGPNGVRMAFEQRFHEMGSFVLRERRTRNDNYCRANRDRERREGEDTRKVFPSVSLNVADDETSVGKSALNIHVLGATKNKEGPISST